VKIVVVKWKDASVQTGDVQDGYLRKECHMITSGLLVEHEDGYLSIAQDIYTNQDCFRYVTHIPEGMIISKKTVEVKLAK
jgi:hypothetical protein